LAAPVALAVLWSVFAPFYHLPSVAGIVLATVEMVEAGTYFHDIGISVLRGLLGFLLGFGLGAALGVVTGRYPRVFLLLGGLLLLLRWTPVLALLPLTIRVGGLGEGPKVFLVAWACFFISWAYTHVAVSKLNPAYVWWSDSLGLTVRQRLLRVYAPAVSPSLIGAARVGLAVAMIVVVAAELGGTLQEGFFREGLGYRISRAVETNRNDINVACILTLGVVGVALDFLLVQFVKRGLLKLTGMDFYRDEG
jgi:sulfonate transport system permease protein